MNPETIDRLDRLEREQARLKRRLSVQNELLAALAVVAPDAVMVGGHVSKRGTKAAGFLIYDEEGIERGGYVTLDSGSNAMLSLDSKHRMLANMIAGPGEGGTSVLNLRGDAKKQLELRMDPDGARMSTSDDGRVALQVPEILELAPGTCSHWKDLDARHPGENVCRSRFGETACKACLDHP